MEAVKKYWFWGIFISILSIFAMSHNANAININLENYSIYSSISSRQQNCRLQSGQTYSGSTFCMFTAETGLSLLKEIRTSSVINGLKQGDIIEFYLVIANRVNYNVPGGSYYINEVYGGDDDLTTLSYELVDDFNSLDYYATENNLPGENVGFISDFWANAKIAKVYRITQIVNTDGNHNIGFNISSTSANRYIFNFYQNQDYSIYFSIKNITIYRQSESKENKEVEEKTQGAVDDSQAAGGSSSSDAQTGTTGLLNAITGAVNVITAARPSNCKINGNMGNLDMGQLDLCANPAPAFVQTIGSLILILMCVPLAISLFNRFIAIFRSFQS